MNFKFPRGDDQVLALEFTENGAVKDITGWTIYFTLKKNIEDSDASAVLKKDITTHTDPTNGKTEIPLLNTETDVLEGIYFYDIQYKDVSTPAIVKTVLSGQMTFTEDVTRRKA